MQELVSGKWWVCQSVGMNPIDKTYCNHGFPGLHINTSPTSNLYTTLKLHHGCQNLDERTRAFPFRHLQLKSAIHLHLLDGSQIPGLEPLASWWIQRSIRNLLFRSLVQYSRYVISSRTFRDMNPIICTSIRVPFGRLLKE